MLTHCQEKELEQLHNRVKTAVAKKDETIQSLKEEVQLLHVKVQQQELLLEKQRNSKLNAR